MERDETYSIMGCAAGLCDHLGPFDPPAHRRGRPRLLRPGKVKASDAVPVGTCGRCGLIGEHQNSRDCIDALRDRLAVIER